MKIVEKSGGSEEHAWESGVLLASRKSSRHQHADLNAGKEPIEVMIVELEKEH